MRRILTIIVIVGFASFAIWYTVFRNKQTLNQPIGVWSFFPTGEQGDVPDGSITTDNTLTEGAPSNQPEALFTQMTTQPIAGYTIFSEDRTVTTATNDPKKPLIETVTDYTLRYVARGNGYVYEVKNSDAPLQITNINIPNIYEAFFINNTALVRFLRSDNKTIASYIIPIPPENTDGSRTQRAGIYLTDNIKSIASNPTINTIISVVPTQNGSTIQTIANNKTTTIFQSPLREWITSIANTKNIFLQTRASVNSDGYLYALDQNNQKLKRVLGNIKGLTAQVSPNASFVIYAQSSGNTFITSILDTKTGVTTPLNLSILPEKCVWTSVEDVICAGGGDIPFGVYPDSWYAGLVSFSDKLYRIDPKTSTYTVLYRGEDATFDMTELKVDERRSFVYFINKKDGLLWRFKY